MGRFLKFGILLTSVGTGCGLYFFVRMLLNAAHMHSAQCHLVEFSDPETCYDCLFVVEAYVASLNKTFFAYDWFIEAEYDLASGLYRPAGSMFRCCPNQPFDCCDFIRDDQVCDVVPGGSCPSVPWDCTIHYLESYDIAAMYGTNGTRRRSELTFSMRQAGLQRQHLTKGHNNVEHYIYGISFGVLLYAWLQLLYIYFLWGFCTRFGKDARSGLDPLWMLYNTWRERKGRRLKAVLFIQAQWRLYMHQHAISRRAAIHGAKDIHLGVKGIIEVQKSLLHPKRVEYMYLYDSHNGEYSKRVTRTRNDFAIGQRIEVLTVMLGRDEDLTLRLSKDDTIEDSYSADGYPGPALRPKVKRVQGELAHLHVTNRHALRRINGSEIDVRDDRDLEQIVNLQKRPLVMEFITIPTEWTTQKKTCKKNKIATGTSTSPSKEYPMSLVMYRGPKSPRIARPRSPPTMRNFAGKVLPPVKEPRRKALQSQLQDFEDASSDVRHAAHRMSENSSASQYATRIDVD